MSWVLTLQSVRKRFYAFFVTVYQKSKIKGLFSNSPGCQRGLSSSESGSSRICGSSELHILYNKHVLPCYATVDLMIVQFRPYCQVWRLGPLDNVVQPRHS